MDDGIVVGCVILAIMFAGTPDLYDALIFYLSGADMDTLTTWAKEHY